MIMISSVVFQYFNIVLKKNYTWYHTVYCNIYQFSVDLRTIGIADSPIIVDRSPPVAGRVNDGEIFKIDLEYTMYPDKVQ